MWISNRAAEFRGKKRVSLNFGHAARRCNIRAARGLHEPPEISRGLKGLQGAGGKLCRTLQPAKEKVRKEEVSEKKMLHRKRREGKNRPAGHVFEAINSEGGGFRK